MSAHVSVYTFKDNKIMMILSTNIDFLILKNLITNLYALS